MSLFGPQRRIVTSHGPLQGETQEPPVVVHTDEIAPRAIRTPENPTGLEAWIAPIWTNTHPAINTYGMERDEADEAQGRLVIPGGSNLQVTDLAPNVAVGMHRTPSIDYNIIVKGEATLITPDGNGGTVETLARPGDVVVQRGTLHAWRAGPEGVRWICVLISAERVKGEDGKELPDVEL
jgi:hypothetical protein